MSQSNGKATVGNKPQANNGNKVSTVAKTEPQKQETSNPPKAEPPSITPLPKPDLKAPSIEDKFYKMDTLFSLRDKHEKITESLDKLNRFNLSSDGRSDNITFTDSAKNSFTTHSPEVLKKTIEALKVDCKEKLAAIEKEIAAAIV